MAKIYGALEVAQLEWFTQSPDTRPSAASNTYRVIYASDVKQVQISDGTNWIAFINGSTNQTLAGNITFSGQQIFSGLHRLSVTTDSSSTGAITALNNTTPVIEFTAAVTSISGIANSASGATVMLVNRTGGTVAVLDEDAGATAANRIRTGTGAQISLANNASILLTYVGDSRWHVIGGSGSGSGSAGINYITNGSAEADTLGWTTYAETDAVTFTDVGDLVSTASAHNLSNNAQISFTSITSTTGISVNTTYYVINATSTTFQVASSVGGSALALTTNGSGTMVRYVPKTASGGSASVTITRSTTTPLIGTASFILTKDAANREGQGWEYDFTIDRGYQAKVLQISFQYLVNSAAGTFVAGTSSSVSDVTVWIYDVTNGVMIQPSSSNLLSNNTSIADTFNATFQTASNSTAYRLIFHVATPSITAYSLKVDGISVSPSTYIYGTPVTDWQSYTPTGSWTVNATYTGKYRRVGDSIEIQGRVLCSAAPTPAGVLSVNLPAGFSIDTNKINLTTQPAVFGSVMALDNGVQTYAGTVSYNTATSIRFILGTNGTITNAAPFAFGNTDEVDFMCVLPIVGLSSSVQTSDQTDTRIVDLVVNKNATQSVTANLTNVTFAVTVKDSHGAWNGSVYTVPVAGDYFVSAITTNSAAAQSNVCIYKNGTGVAGVGSFLTGTYASGTPTIVTGIVPCVAGDTLSVRDGFTQTLGAGGNFNVSRISGPSAIAATETVAASYWASANGTSSTTTAINFDSREYDTHNAVTPGANWRFTAPVSGTYSVALFSNQNSVTTAYYYIYKNSTTTSYKVITYTNTTVGLVTGTTSLKLNAGDFIGIYTGVSTPYQGNASLSSNTLSHISITRTGN